MIPKKGQLTIFIIVGIIAMFLVIFMISMKNSDMSDHQILDVKHIDTYLSSCLDNSLEKSLTTVGLNRTNIISYVQNNLEACDLHAFEEQGLDIEVANIDVDVEIGDEHISALVDYPVEISNGKDIVRMKEFESDLILTSSIILTDLSDSYVSDDDVFHMLIPSNIDATLDGDPVQSIQVTIMDSSDSNIYSPVIYELQPSGAIFNQFLYVRLHYIESNLPIGFDEENLRVMIRNDGADWSPLVTQVDTIANTVSANISHFSEIGIGSVNDESCYVDIQNFDISSNGFLIPSVTNFSFVDRISNMPLITGFAVPENEEYLYILTNVAPAAYEGQGWVGACSEVGSCREVIELDPCSGQQGFRKIRTYNNKLYIVEADVMENKDLTVDIYNGTDRIDSVSFPFKKSGMDILAYNDALYFLANGQGILNCMSGGTMGGRLYCDGPDCEPGLLGYGSHFMTVWQDKMLIMGSDASGFGGPGPNLKIVHYDGYTIESYDTDKVMDFEYAQEFKGQLYTFATDGLYRSENGINFSLVPFFENYGCSGDRRRFLADMAVMNNKIYVSVVVGRQDRFDWLEEDDILEQILNFFTGDDCDVFHQSSVKETVDRYEIFSSDDGLNWTQVFTHRSGIQRVEADAKFPIVAFRDRIYAGVADQENPGGANSLGKGMLKVYASIVSNESYFVSNPYDLGNFTSGIISWDMENGTGSTVMVQVRTGATYEDVLEAGYFGPDGTNTSYYTDQGSEFLPETIDDTWIQYRLILRINDDSEPPILKNIVIRKGDEGISHQECITKYI